MEPLVTGAMRKLTVPVSWTCSWRTPSPSQIWSLDPSEVPRSYFSSIGQLSANKEWFNTDRPRSVRIVTSMRSLTWGAKFWFADLDFSPRSSRLLDRWLVEPDLPRLLLLSPPFSFPITYTVLYKVTNIKLKPLFSCVLIEGHFGQFMQEWK